MQITISSQLTTIVPVLDGTNYTTWAATAKAWLQSTGLWKVIARHERPDTPDVKRRAVAEGADPATGRITNQDELDKAAQEQEEWDDENEKAMGSIRLRLSPAMAQIVKGETTAKDMWEALEAAHTQKTLGNAYVEFQGLIGLTIPNDSSPASAIAKFKAYIEKLAEMHVPIHHYIALMLFLNKMPPYASQLCTIMTMSVELKDLGDDGNKGVRTGPSTRESASSSTFRTGTDPNLEEVYKQLQASWEQRKLRGSKSKADNAQRATGIKRKGDNPSFQQQQQQGKPQGNNQQQQQGGEKKKRQRGKRAGKGKEREDHGHSHVAGIAFTPQGVVYTPPLPTAVNPKPALESRLESDRPVSKGKHQYPKMRKSMNLLDRLDIPTSFERIRALEEVVEATAHNQAGPSASIVEVEEPDEAWVSPRPNKRVRLTPERFDWAEEVAASSARNSPVVNSEGIPSYFPSIPLPLPLLTLTLLKGEGLKGRGNFKG